jgi:acyl-CoA reductase-like NAD-dependent aldehyde dehydrogenase
MSAAFEPIDGVPNYNLYVGGKWVRSSRNQAVESRNPATGELFAKVQQPGAPETEAAISAAHGAYKAWAATPVSAREAIFFGAADVRGALPLADKSGSFLKRHFLEYFAPTSEAATGTMAFGIWNGG